MNSLLFLKCLHHSQRSGFPRRVKNAGVAGGAPVRVRESNGVAERVKLPLALGHAWLHIRLVVDRPAQRRIGGVARESIRVRVDKYASSLPADHARDEPRQPGIFFRKVNIWVHLRRRITQPHCVNVAGDNKSVGLAIQRTWKNSGVEGIRKAALKHRSQHGIGNLRLDSHNRGFDGRALKMTIRKAGPSVGRRPCARNQRCRNCGRGTQCRATAQYRASRELNCLLRHRLLSASRDNSTHPPRMI